MNTFNSLGKLFRKLALCTVVACPVLGSCEQLGVLQDPELQDKLDNIIARLEELELSMNDQIKTLEDLVKKTEISISSVEVNEETGVTTVTLSNETELKLYPKENLESFLTYFTDSVSGVICWAYIDNNGLKQPFKDKDGNYIPVSLYAPEVVVEDEDTWLVIGGERYPLSGNSVFSDYEVHKNEMTGEIYAVTFTFGEGMSFTVTVDGVGGVMFLDNEGAAAISDLYVPYGYTNRVHIYTQGVVDYIVQAPAGWTLREGNDQSDVYFDVTAPSAGQVESGAAAAGGNLKLLAVLEGGKSAMARLNLCADGFSNVGVDFGKLTIQKRGGIDKFAYGVSKESEYSAETVLVEAKALLDLNESGVSMEDILSEPIAELVDTELVPGERYVLWAVPAIWEGTDYYIPEGSIVATPFRYSSITLELSSVSSLDAALEMELKGIDGYCMGLVEKSEFDASKIAMSMNMGSYPVETENFAYTGSLFAFMETEIAPDTEYVLWLVLAEEGKVYGKTDIITREFLVPAFAEGGNAGVSVSGEEVSYRDVKATLSAENAVKVYYAFMGARKAQSYPDNASRAAYLFSSFAKSSSATDAFEVKASDFISGIVPETSVVLMAVAVDSEGKYGEVVLKEYKTPVLEYNDLALSIELTKNTPDLLEFKIDVTGGEPVEYLYWVGTVDDNFWKSSIYLGAKAESAQVFMSVNSDDERLSRKTEMDGQLLIEGLNHELQYAIVMVAKDESGRYSKAAELMFSPYKYDVGTLVTKDDPKWEELTSKIKFEWLTQRFVASVGMRTGEYALNLTLSPGYTAYVMCGNDDGLTDENGVYVNMTPVEKTLLIMTWADKYMQKEYYDEWWYCAHGWGLFGQVVLWASEEFHHSVCDCGGNTQVESLSGVLRDQKIFLNEGEPVVIVNTAARGSTTEEFDKVYVVYQDLEGNCYEPFDIYVPLEHFQNAPKN